MLKQRPSVSVALKEVADVLADAVVEKDQSKAIHLKETRKQSSKEFEDDLKYHGKPFPIAFETESAMVDREDGVSRCPHCHWEVHGEVCENCGHDIYNLNSDNEGEDDEEEGSDIDLSDRQRRRLFRRIGNVDESYEDVEPSEYEEDGFVVGDDEGEEEEDDNSSVGVGSRLDSHFSPVVEYNDDEYRYISDNDDDDDDDDDVVMTSTRRNGGGSGGVVRGRSSLPPSSNGASNNITNTPRRSRQQVILTDSEEDDDNNDLIPRNTNSNNNHAALHNQQHQHYAFFAQSMPPRAPNTVSLSDEEVGDNDNNNNNDDSGDSDSDEIDTSILRRPQVLSDDEPPIRRAHDHEVYSSSYEDEDIDYGEEGMDEEQDDYNNDSDEASDY